MSNVCQSLCEAFVCGRQNLSHHHVGSLYTADERMTLENACDVYTHRSEGCSIWVVRASEVVVSQPEERGEFPDPAGGEIYRRPAFYAVLDGTEHMWGRK